MSKTYKIEEKYIAQEKSFHEMRRWLLSQTFFTYKLVRYLRHELHIPLDGFSTEEEGLDWEREHKTILDYTNLPNDKGGSKSQWRQDKELMILYSKNKREVFKPIYDVIDKFPQQQLEFTFLRGLVLGYKEYFQGTEELPKDNQIYTVQSFDDPITEFGIYIKYSPWLNDKEFLALKKKAQNYYNHMFNIPKQEENRKRENTSKITKYFLSVELLCISWLIERPKYFKGHFSMNEIFDIVATGLKIKSSIIRNNYYRIQKRYYLPGITEVFSIPTL